MTNDILDVFETGWDDIPDAPPAVPTGEYHGKVTKCEPFISKEKQTPGVAVEIVVQAGEQAGRTVRTSIWKTEKSLWAFKRFFGKKGLDILPPAGKPNFKAAEGWEGVFKVTTKVEEGKEFPDYRIVPLSKLA